MSVKNLSEAFWQEPNKMFSVPAKTAELKVNGAIIASAQGCDEIALSDALSYVFKYIVKSHPAILPPDESVQIDVRISASGSRSILDI